MIATRKRWLTKPEARRLLRVGWPTLNSLIATGALPAHRVGGKMLFRRSAALRLLSRRKGMRA